MPAVTEVFPAALIDRDRKDDFIALLQTLPIRDLRKKELLVEWCRITGAVLTEDMVRELLGPAPPRGV